MNTDRLSDSDMRAEAEGNYAAAIAELRTQPPSKRIPEAVPASRCIITDADTTTLTLYSDDGALAVIVLGPADAVRIASDLLNAARRRFGRGRPEDQP